MSTAEWYKIFFFKNPPFEKKQQKRVYIIPKKRARGMMMRSSLNNSYVYMWQNQSTLGDDGYNRRARPGHHSTSPTGSSTNLIEYIK
jgi:hypothetical protein